MGILIMLTGMIAMVPVVLFATLCMTNMIFADSLIAAILAGGILRAAFHVHPVFCILVSCAVFALVTKLYLDDRSVRILIGISTLLWGYVGGFLVYDLSGEDRIWAVFAAILIMFVTGTFRLGASYAVRRRW